MLRRKIPHGVWRLPLNVRALSRRHVASRAKPKERGTTHWKNVETVPGSLSSVIAETARRNSGPANKTETARIVPQIVSSKLCDDVIDYHGHTLEKYKGCDIIDINPGAGVWTSKLHEFLQPRSHILIEPDIKIFEQFLKPLLDKPGSKYKLAPYDPTVFESLNQLVKDGYLPHQKMPEPNDPQANEINNTLLVTGTIAWDPVLPGFGVSSMARQILYSYTELAWQKQIFHAFGPTRMLLWHLDEDSKVINPKSLNQLGRGTFTLRKFAETREIVAPGPRERGFGRDAVGREARYEIEGIAKTMKAMESRGTSLPTHRRSLVHDIVDDVIKKTDGTAIMTVGETTEYLRLRALQDLPITGLVTNHAVELFKFADVIWPGVTFDMKLPTSKAPAKRTKQPPVLPPHIDRAAGLDLTVRTRSLRGLEQKRQKKDAVVDLGEAVYQLECQILKMDDGNSKTKALERLKGLQQKFDQAHAALDGNYRTGVNTDLDDCMSLRSGFPRIDWDKRTMEPLVMQPDEFWPANRMSLSDIEPLPNSEALSLQDIQYFIDFIYGLLSSITADLPHALEDLQSGAGDLIEEVPALRDPSRGGRLSMDRFRARSLTMEMATELFKAYREWPFRNPDTDISNFFRSKSNKPGSEFTF
ncbi:S-adenosyl-L-methionine-dependent methyltransferase [Aaosphaeria arxii CBS 175.79]|uniref:S-adenosyl-L-methionine-dependent methyltransferase n=1 Tax=Aaosphaeria arxii CBS 175.79 TaxID=1450172 RepID=A0A6A5Y1J9_9PLEO|nr:S-adenosyl-L-methionine-dependent methyltransferase [Aaosphaeria arxii CBS 175.79]KAF2018434.1 S-adenosyl-L-methionine-dependent methyltransferase [Aaosphaeria arxii CBS 175.79]